MTAVADVPEHYTRLLDHGFVGLVDHMGGDDAIVQAARISIAGTNVKATSSDRGLIRYLLRMWHTTPFEMVQLKFHAKMPMFVARQWVRHRMASINEMSARYSELPGEFYIPEPENLKKQAINNKQGRSEEGFTAAEMDEILHIITTQSENGYYAYQRLLELGLARELSRMVLPVNIYTEWYWKTDLHNMFHFLRLRMNPHAQWEIRIFANAMAEMVKSIAPIAFEAFEDFRLNSMALTAQDCDALGAFIPEDVGDDELEMGLFKTKREQSEFIQKYRTLTG